MRSIAFSLVLIMCFTTIAQTGGSPGADLLFSKVKSGLTPAQKAKIYELSGLQITPDRKQFVVKGDENLEAAFTALVYPTDMNNDGKEEIFILYGNTYYSGHTGSSIILFIQDDAGNYKMNFGFPGTLPDLLQTKNLGYPDLLVGGPGFEFPVFRWNGKAYVNYKTVQDSEWEKLMPKSVEVESKEYAKGLD